MKRKSPPRIVVYRGRYYISYYSPSGERTRVALSTDNRAVAEEAFDLWKRIQASVPRTNGDARTARSWLTKRFNAARSRAKRRDIEISIDRDDMDCLFRRSKGRCELTGIPFDLSRPVRGERQPFRMSLDRIDADKGYHFDNCRLVSSAVNFAMGRWGEATLFEIARGLIKAANQDAMKRIAKMTRHASRVE